jgi:predicted DNA-binding transcriptional regulator AlpA
MSDNSPLVPLSVLATRTEEAAKQLVCTAVAAQAAGISVSQLYTLVKAGDFPRALHRGMHSLPLVAKWVADRKAGKPLPVTGRILTHYMAGPRLMLTAEVLEATRMNQATLSLRVCRSDFPRPLARGAWHRTAVEDWIRDRKAGKPLFSTGLLAPEWHSAIGIETIGITTAEMYEMTRLMPIEIYRLVKRKDFPKPLPHLRGKYSAAEVRQWAADRNAGKPLPNTKEVPSAWYEEHKAVTTYGRRRPKPLPGRHTRKGPVFPYQWIPLLEVIAILKRWAIQDELKRQDAPGIKAESHQAIVDRVEKDWTPDRYGQRDVYDRMAWESENRRSYDEAEQDGEFDDPPQPTMIPGTMPSPVEDAPQSPRHPPPAFRAQLPKPASYEGKREAQAATLATSVAWQSDPKGRAALLDDREAQLGRKLATNTSDTVPKENMPPHPLEVARQNPIHLAPKWAATATPEGQSPLQYDREEDIPDDDGPGPDDDDGSTTGIDAFGLEDF